MRILALGDVFGEAAVGYLETALPRLLSFLRPELVIANAENASGSSGVEPLQAQRLFEAGCDVLTGGNHTFGRKAFSDYLEAHENALRPANYPAGTPGGGYTVCRAANGARVLVVSLRGNLGFPAPLACPFETLERILAREAGHYDYSAVDFHAEYTSEKVAMGRAFDGRVSVLFGTHTHVPTADETVLPGGTGYITDLGMTGPVDGVLGVRSEIVVSAMKTKLPAHFETAKGEIRANGALFTLSEEGRCLAAERISF
ncbi:MAG: YmdB family metallophosphoesterase [Clostridia bacterium]|nr:YmdB family metallophosphoesterase [Clostridia bacterium]